MAELQKKPEKGAKPGTPEGDRMVRVRCMRDVIYGPTAKLERRYSGPCDEFPDGEELTIPAWRFTDYDEVDTSKGIPFRGSFVLADKPKPVSTNVAEHPEEMQELMAQNSDYAKRIAELEKQLSGKPAPEPLVAVDQRRSGRKQKEEEI